MFHQSGSVFAKVHDVPEGIDPDTGTTLEAAVEIELDIVVGEKVHCMNIYVPPRYTFIQIRESLQNTTRSLATKFGYPPDTPVKFIEYRHVQKV